MAGRMLLLEGKTDDAIKVMQANREAFSVSGGAQYSAGDAYATAGDWSKAKECFEQALKIDPLNSRAMELLRHIQ